jgi:hypothetical protein
MKVVPVIQSVTSALLALISVLGTFLIVFYQLTNGKPIVLPDFSALLIGAVIGSYLTHVASSNGARQAGVAAAQVAVTQAQGGDSHPPSVA